MNSSSRFFVTSSCKSKHIFKIFNRKKLNSKNIYETFPFLAFPLKIIIFKIPIRYKETWKKEKKGAKRLVASTDETEESNFTINEGE